MGVYNRMRCAKIDKCELCNGNNIGVSLFTSFCPYHCPHCHNMSTWGINSGREYPQEDKEKILELVKPDYIHRFSILGGQPLLPQNVYSLLDLVHAVREIKPNISIWLWTGTTIEAIKQFLSGRECEDETFASLGWTKQNKQNLYCLLMECDCVIDGRFEEDKKDLTLKWRGSSNQKIWDALALHTYLK